MMNYMILLYALYFNHIKQIIAVISISNFEVFREETKNTKASNFIEISLYFVVIDISNNMMAMQIVFRTT
jgi:hypothetical protein